MQQVTATSFVQGRTPKGRQAPMMKGGFPTGQHVVPFFRDKTGFLQRVSRECGPVGRIRMGGMTFHVVSAPEWVKYVYENPEIYNKDSEAFRQMATWLGQGLSTNPGGESWRRHRRIAQPQFGKRPVNGLLPILNTALADHLKRWNTHIATQQPFDLHLEMRAISLRLVGEALMSMDVVDEYREVGLAFADASEELGFRAMHPFRFFDELPLRRNLRYRECTQLLDNVMDDIVRKRRTMANPPQDLLSMLMRQGDAGGSEPLSDEELRDEVKTFFAAGHFTTGAALNWVFCNLAENPEVMKRVQDEIDTVVGEGPIDADQVGRLEQLRRVIMESLRMYPPSWIISRHVAKDDEIAGYHIPQGDQVMISSYVVQRDPKNWENPDQFNPDRFAPEVAPKLTNYTYFPFGGGPRVCLGMQYALTEIQVVVSRVLRDYKLTRHPSYRPGFDPGLSLKPKHGMPFLVARR